MIESLTTVTCIRRGCGKPCPNGGLHCPECLDGVRKRALDIAGGAPFPGRVVLELPWSCLASDNLRAGVMGEAAREKNAQYKAAKERAQEKIREQYQGEPFAGLARVQIVVFVPDRRRRDGGNFIKLIGDAIKGTVLVDDDFEHMEIGGVRRGGVDPDRPRAEITVEAIL